MTILYNGTALFCQIYLEKFSFETGCLAKLVCKHLGTIDGWCFPLSDYIIALYIVKLCDCLSTRSIFQLLFSVHTYTRLLYLVVSASIAKQVTMCPCVVFRNPLGGTT